MNLAVCLNIGRYQDAAGFVLVVVLVFLAITHPANKANNSWRFKTNWGESCASSSLVLKFCFPLFP